MKQDIINLYDAYTHGGMSRRAFLDRLAAIAGGTAAATALLPFLENNYAHAQKVAPDDPSLVTERVSFDAPGGTVGGYLARPRDAETAPAVLVIHENRGLNPHIEDVARRFASEGFLALSVDLLSTAGGTPDDPDAAREMIGALDPDVALEGAVAAARFLAEHPNSNGAVGVVGFCWGGSLVNRLAASEAPLAAAVSCYGEQLPAEQVPEIDVPLMLHYAGLDERINAGIPAFEAALKEHGKEYRLFMYEGVNHAFNNDTNAARYDEAAANEAWQRTVGFLREQLGAD